MSNVRHVPPRVRSYAITHPPGKVMLPTQPGWDAVVFSHASLVTATTDAQAWTIPAHRALCVPDGTRVRIACTRRAAIRCVYFDQKLGVMDEGLRVVPIGSLARELLAHAVDRAPMQLEEAADRALVTLIADQLGGAADMPLHLPLPADAVARDVAAAVMADPVSDLGQVLAAANASRRTIERRFSAETGMSLGHWRRRARILAALDLLAQGVSVTETALTIGYASPSAFVSAFRAELGAPPRAFMRS